MTSDAEALTDEHKQDFDEIERLSKEFTQKWKSFFVGFGKMSNKVVRKI